MLSYRRFDREDWCGWGGATKFASGREPIIAGDEKGGAFSVEGQPALVVAGGEGLDVYWGNELEKRVFFFFPAEKWRGEIELKTLLLLEKFHGHMSLAELLELGFENGDDEE